MGKVKILIVDDHELLRRGIIELLSSRSSITVVGEASNGREAIDMARKTKPDIILLDISMPELNGMEAIEQIKQACPAGKIIIMTMHDLNKYITGALKHGVAGYLLKDIDALELFEAIDKVSQGELYLCDKINQKVIGDYASMIGEETSKTSADTLSPREREVLQLVVEGYTGKEIAHKMSISPKTVEHHRYHLMSKMGCSNVAHLIRAALKEGLVNLN